MLKKAYSNYNNIIFNLILILPFLDIYRALIGNKFEILGISIVEIANTVVTILLFGLLLIKLKIENKKILSKKFVCLVSIIIVYVILHGVYILSLKDLDYLNTNVSFIVECYYIMRTYILPLIVLFVYMKSELSSSRVVSTLSKLSFIFSIIIVITNIFGLSLVAYSSEYEGIVKIEGNIFTWFSLTEKSNIDLYTSKGLFYSTNQISAILGSLLFASAFYTLEKDNLKYYLSFLIKVIAVIMLSTKTAFFAIFLSIISVLVYNLITHILNKKNKINRKSFIFIGIALLVVIIYQVSPIKYKLNGYISNINNNSIVDLNNDDLNKECYVHNKLEIYDNLSLEKLTKESKLTNIEKKYLAEYIEKCPKIFNIHKEFVKLYPVNKNYSYWKKKINQPISELTDYRSFKYSIYVDFIKKHNNNLDKLFGIGYSSNFPYLEKDFIGQYIWLGLIGVLLFLVPYLLIIVKSLLKIVLNFKKSFQSNTIALLLASLFMIIASFLAGHVFGIFMTTTILAFIISGLYSSVNEKIEIEKNKITILALHLGVGGTEKYLSSLCKMLEDNYNIELISTYKIMDKPAFEFSDKVKITYLINDYPHREEFNLALKKKNIFLVIRYGFNLAKILFLKYIKNILSIKKINSNYIITTRGFHNKLVGKNKNDNIITIATEHNYHNNDNKYIKKTIKSCENIDYFVVVSEELKEFYTEKFKNYNMNTKCIYIPNVIDSIPKYVSKERITNKLVSMGRLVHEKGFEDLIDIINIVKKNIPNIQLDIYGDGVLKEKLYNKIEKLKLENNINLCGFCPFEEIFQKLKSYDLYLMTSHTESFGLVLIEAMSNSLACIAFDSASGARQILKNGNGILIKNRDKNEYAKEVVNKLSNLSEINKLSKKGYNSAKKYELCSVKSEWIELLKGKEKKNV